jgi:Protein of unknown function (DUF3102)
MINATPTPNPDTFCTELANLPSSDYGTMETKYFTQVACEVMTAASVIRTAVERAIYDVGREYTKVRNLPRHGDFMEWLDAEFAMSDRTARHYMQAATLADELCARSAPRA